MRKYQRGVSIGALLGICAFLIVGALIGLKLAPVYIEYFQIKKSVAAVALAGGASVGEVRKSFDKRAQVDEIVSITGEDLEITKDGGDLVITFAYPMKVHLFGNVSVLFDFAGSSKGR